MKELNRKEAGTYTSNVREEVLSSRAKRKTVKVDIKKPNLLQRISPIQYAVIGVLAFNILVYIILK
ncbi:hypothetical protein N9562_00425 [Flavobacteriaceae bacterium]|nr:hypothetical protein [Flavobacteriaceae bacterium]